MVKDKRRALVTGGNRGIGLAVAAGLAQAGVETVIGSRNLARGVEEASRIGTEAVELDVTDPRSIVEAVKKVGKIDILVNNAGVLFREPMLANPANFESSISIMLTGPYLLIREVAPQMIERGYGRIVNVSSGYGSFAEGLGGPGAYCVAKAALNAMTVCLSRELPETIKINTMCPGWVRTDLGGKDAPRTPEEGADTAIWLATLGDDGPTGGYFRDRKPIAW